VAAATAVCALLATACGGSGGIARAVAPPLPDTTGTPMASATPSPSASPSPSPTAAPTATPSPTPAEGGVTRVPPTDTNGDDTVAADLYPSSGAANCLGSGSTGYGACPVTDRLAARLNQHPFSGGEQLCRCQAPWQGVTITAPPVLPAITTYTVEVDLNFGSSIEAKFDVIVLEESDGWFADDIQCHDGGSQTSIYASSPPHC